MPYEVLTFLPLPDEMSFTIFHASDGWPKAGIIVTLKGEAVGSTTRCGDNIAQLYLRQKNITGNDIPPLTELSSDAYFLCGFFSELTYYHCFIS
jgi:hypothetical protein